METASSSNDILKETGSTRKGGLQQDQLTTIIGGKTSCLYSNGNDIANFIQILVIVWNSYWTQAKRPYRSS